MPRLTGGAGGLKLTATPARHGPVGTPQVHEVIGLLVVEACRLLEPGLVIPVHRSGWAHFREPEETLRATLAEAGLSERCRFLDLGESTTVTA